MGKKTGERYRSGHNEAVLKTVCLHGHMGSNPILSAEYASILFILNLFQSLEIFRISLKPRPVYSKPGMS